MNLSSKAGSGYNGLTANWQLQSTSPCINAGDTTGVSQYLPTLDLAGNPRINGIIDMGGYERQPQVPVQMAISGIILASGTPDCYNATQTITVAGNGTIFKIQDGGSATMIAGQEISPSRLKATRPRASQK